MRYIPDLDKWIYTPGSLIELATPKSCAPAVTIDSYGVYSINGLTGRNSLNSVESIVIPATPGQGKNFGHDR